MEQSLINQLIRLLCKGGAETFVGNFQREVDEDNKPQEWTASEIKEACEYIKYINEYFGRDEAVAIVTSLIAKYNISLEDLALRPPLKVETGDPVELSRRTGTSF
jgi:hypothetical protein